MGSGKGEMRRDATRCEEMRRGAKRCEWTPERCKVDKSREPGERGESEPGSLAGGHQV